MNWWVFDDILSYYNCTRKPIEAGNQLMICTIINGRWPLNIALKINTRTETMQPAFYTPGYIV